MMDRENSPSLVVVIALACLAGALPCLSGDVYAQRDWVQYGQDAGGSKFSTLDQINTTNVAKLERAWVVHTGDTGGFFFS